MIMIIILIILVIFIILMIILMAMMMMNSILWAVGTPSHEYLSNWILCLHSWETFNSNKNQRFSPKLFER